jgi:hypothetical protein
MERIRVALLQRQSIKRARVHSQGNLGAKPEGEVSPMFWRRRAIGVSSDYPFYESIAQELVDEAGECLVKEFRPEAIYLLGSHAW